MKIHLLLLTTISIASFLLPVACKKVTLTPEENKKGSNEDNGPHLLKEDKYWDLQSVHGKYGSANYHGSYKPKNFYEKMQTVNGKYEQLSIDEWYDTFDSKEILNDKNHKYALNAPTSFDDYETKVVGKGIYNSKFKKTPKTGDNNNPKDAIYCGAAFKVDNENEGGLFDLGTIVTTDNKPWKRGTVKCSYEHVIPQAYIKDSSINSKEKGHALGDGHMLRPSLRSGSKPYDFNNWRANDLFGMLSLSPYKGVNVDFEVGYPSWGGSYRLVEPRVNVRGDIARIHFYMHDRYHIMYPKAYYEMFIVWAALDPVTKEELEFETVVKNKLMGFDNDYVTGKKQIPYSQAVNDHLKRFNLV